MSDDTYPHADHRKAELYLAGRAGDEPDYPMSYAALREAAEATLGDEARAYLSGGAGRERTMAANREAFERWALRPRMLRGVESTDLSTPRPRRATRPRRRPSSGWSGRSATPP